MVAWGACMVAPGGCIVAPGGHAWLLGGMRGCSGGHAWFFPGACVVFPRGVMHGFSPGGVHRIRWDTVNEQAVRILLECILVNRRVFSSNQRCAPGRAWIDGDPPPRVLTTETWPFILRWKILTCQFWENWRGSSFFFHSELMADTGHWWAFRQGTNGQNFFKKINFWDLSDRFSTNLPKVDIVLPIFAVILPHKICFKFWFDWIFHLERKQIEIFPCEPHCESVTGTRYNHVPTCNTRDHWMSEYCSAKILHLLVTHMSGINPQLN